ncbi:hypothetical protein IV203_020935 [Nitzschia inconspicua]|uniref:Uncharacterized protein n=1 Tax=Nitzschia inconspicua TaxID=303405 RepID=A0A9K3KGY1_9STRA|nr:hypothetical protein IV203_020935 [Nitzschia inconspicua]
MHASLVKEQSTLSFERNDAVIIPVEKQGVRTTEIHSTDLLVTKPTSSHSHKRKRPRNSGRISADTPVTIPVYPPERYPLPLKVSFRGVAGIGHRLLRQSNAYHLSKGLYLDSISIGWGWCYSFGDTKNRSHVTSRAEIFPSLFGNTTIPIPRQPHGELRLPPVNFPFIQAIRWNNTLLKRHNNFQTRSLEFVNEVWQYNERQQSMLNMKRHHYYGKHASDLEMYQTLVQDFQYRDRIDYWKESLQFHNHTVIGLHVREGNGEKGDFYSKKRGIQEVSEDEWLSNLAQLLLNFTNSWFINFRNEPLLYPPLIFLATDSSNATRLARQLEHSLARAAIWDPTTTQPSDDFIPRVVTVRQPRVPDGKGVSYEYMFETKEDCLEGWISQMVDMILLAESNVVVAGQYSSFTQSIPLSFQFNKAATRNTGNTEDSPNGLFCNVGVKATVMECFDTFSGWIGRKSKMPLVGDTNGQGPQHKNLIPMPVHTMTLRKTLHQRLKDLPIEIVNLG